MDQPIERRERKRYPVQLPLTWKLFYRKKLVASGMGQTLDMSSGGVSFEPFTALPDNGKLELAIAWPALHESGAELQMIVKGFWWKRENAVVVRMDSHEWKTVRKAEPIQKRWPFLQSA